jgi:site-specific DNA recombinase
MSRSTNRSSAWRPSRQLGTSDRKLKQYKATLDAGGDPAVVSDWIKQSQSERAAALSMLRQADSKPTITKDDIARTIEHLGDMVMALHDGAGEIKTDLYRNIGLRATFDPETKKVRAEVSLDLAPPDASPLGFGWCPRGDLNPHAP